MKFHIGTYILALGWFSICGCSTVPDPQHTSPKASPNLQQVLQIHHAERTLFMLEVIDENGLGHSYRIDLSQFPISIHDQLLSELPKQAHIHTHAESDTLLVDLQRDSSSLFSEAIPPRENWQVERGFLILPTLEPTDARQPIQLQGAEGDTFEFQSFITADMIKAQGQWVSAFWVEEEVPVVDSLDILP
ncbi:hypothetical protein [Pontibacter sp. G13]|uniref:hypothetical protein n=1 Tax=Pontibacter sp. G13 TaxID=3074898 RepID=UPI00288AEA1D|nr:hypothetical protein [Pontibacter sp. G13]WNJ19447.1 hypothetical protein RJD25_03050 [Pontibacter sp. G13]